MVRMIVGSIALFAFWLGAHGVVWAHPFHICVGQMQWNKETEVWEVALRLHPQDFEGAMSKALARPIGVDEDDFLEHALPYLQTQFFLLRTTNQTTPKEIANWLARPAAETTKSSPRETSFDDPQSQSTLRWIGTERERGWLWIYLELKPPKESKTDDATWLVHRLLIDQVEAQENSIAIESDGHARYSLQFRRQMVVHKMRY